MDTSVSDVTLFLEIMGLGRILLREYFQRSWVIQEMVLARELQFILGSVVISEDQLLRSTKFYSMYRRNSRMTLFTHSDPILSVIRERHGFESIPQISKPGSITLEEIQGRLKNTSRFVGIDRRPTRWIRYWRY
jgi:hypothetical protein